MLASYCQGILHEIIDQILPGDYRDVFVEWKPTGGEDPHNCVKVTLKRLVSDTDPHDDTAQYNFTVRSSTSASPYKEVVFPFQIRNRGTEPVLYYFRAEGIPEEWEQKIIPDKKLMLPGELLIGELKVKPPPPTKNRFISTKRTGPFRDLSFFIER